MTKEEASIYLSIDEEHDLQDAYEEKLFELKQFFLQRFPISKLINARLGKFEKVQEAFLTLGGVSEEVDSPTEPVLPQFQSIVESYTWYNREKNTLRLKMSSAVSFGQVGVVLKEYLNVTRHYANDWKIPLKDEHDSSIVIGKEPDPMSIQEALNQLPSSEKLTSNYISSLPDENVLKSEAKRLSLWLKFESNE